LNGKKLDFLFIDGDHTYKGVKYKYFEIVDDPNQDGCGIGVSTT